jgi:hypothetical protein
VTERFGYPREVVSSESGDPSVSADTPRSESGTDVSERQDRRRRREARRHERPQGMVPGRERRRSGIERATMRVIATGGIVGVATALGAVLVSQDVAGWIVGLVIGVTSVVLAALLWSSRQL